VRLEEDAMRRLLAAIAASIAIAAAGVAQDGDFDGLDLSQPPPDLGVTPQLAAIYGVGDMTNAELIATYDSLLALIATCEARRDALEAGRLAGRDPDEIHTGWLVYFTSCAAQARAAVFTLLGEALKRTDSGAGQGQVASPGRSDDRPDTIANARRMREMLAEEGVIENRLAALDAYVAALQHRQRTGQWPETRSVGREQPIGRESDEESFVVNRNASTSIVSGAAESVVTTPTAKVE
jgi:hypothetical protein